VVASPLVATRVIGLDDLAVSFAGSQLRDPYLVNLVVAFTGRADISSSSFDGQKPVVFELNVPVLAEIEHAASTSKVGARLEYVEGESAIRLTPSLLPQGFLLRATYLCDGEPVVQPVLELTDISIREGLHIPKPSVVPKYVVWIFALILAALGTTLSSWLA
jgi:hypothetical protein